MPKLSVTVISDFTAQSARPKPRRYEIRDAQLRGFMLRVNPSGTKSWYVQLDRTHKRKIGDSNVLTASMARYRARDLLQRARQLRAAAKGRQQPTLRRFLEGRYGQWIERRCRFGKRDTQRLVSALGELANERIDQLGLSQIERWKLKRARAVSPATLNRELAALKSAMNRAVRWQLIPENPVIQVKMRKDSKPAIPRVLSESERRVLLEHLNLQSGRLETMVKLSLNTGLSRSELFRLRWKDVFFGTNSALEVRGGRSHHNRNRKIPLNSIAQEALKAWKTRRGIRSTLVFPSPSGGPLKSISTSWARLARETGIRKFRFCDCRHDFAARLVMAGVPLSRVSELLGHSTIALTARYSEFAPGTTRDAVDKLVTDSE